MHTQEVSLSWAGHHSTLLNVFEKLLECGKLVDCTIVAEGQRLKAHKEVLSAFSPYFELIFKEENEENPTVILSGITFHELKAFIDFMYHGKVKISEDKVEDLIDAAESLQIKGLGGAYKNNDSERTNECSYLQTRQIGLSDLSSKRKRKKIDKDNASDLIGDSDVKIARENHGSFSQHEVSADVPGGHQVGQTSVVNQKSDASLDESSVHSDMHSTNVTSLHGQTTLPSIDSELQILHPESVVKVELGADDNTILTESEYTVEPKREHNRYSCESGNEESILGISTDVSVSSESNSYEHLLPDHASADVPGSSAAGISQVKCMSSSKNLSSSSSKDQSSLNSKGPCTSVDRQSANIQNALLHSELVVKAEPKEEDDINIPSDACFTEASKCERPEEMALLENRRGLSGREMEAGTYEEDPNLYSGAAFSGADDQWHRSNSLQQSSGSMETSGRGHLGTTISWGPGTTAAGFSGEVRSVRRSLGACRPPRKYSCPECHKVFNQSCNLKVHLRIHTGEKPYKCTECDFAATHISNLKQHLRTHSGERPYKCTECDYAAIDNSSFRRHQRMHNGERPYKCTECDYAASDAGSFKRHLRIHSGERPYKCTECEYATTGSGDLNKHKRIHNRERPIKEAEFDSAVTGTSNLINSIPKYFENFNIYR